MQAIREWEIFVPAPGGDANSQLSDTRNGMDGYVHLCLFNQNPMEYRARQDGRIQSSCFIEIDRDVLRLDGVRFTSAMANQNGAASHSATSGIFDNGRTTNFSTVAKDRSLGR